MKTTNRIINHLLGAVLSLLVTFGLTQSAAAQARITFNAPVTNRRTHQTYSQIFSMNPDKSDLKQLTAANANAYFPSWSGGQTHIAFVRDGILYVMEASGEGNGGQIFPVVPASASGCDWSPDDSMIVFAGTSAMGSGLWIVAVDKVTGTVGTPTLVRNGVCIAPTWSPDGTRVAFALNGMVRVLDLS